LDKVNQSLHEQKGTITDIIDTTVLI